MAGIGNTVVGKAAPGSPGAGAGVGSAVAAQAPAEHAIDVSFMH